MTKKNKYQEHPNQKEARKILKEAKKVLKQIKKKYKNAISN